MNQIPLQLFLPEQSIKCKRKTEVEHRLEQLHGKTADTVGSGRHGVVIDHAEFAFDSVTAAA